MTQPSHPHPHGSYALGKTPVGWLALLGLPLLAVLSLIAAGCGGDNETSTTTPRQTTSPPTSVTATSTNPDGEPAKSLEEVCPNPLNVLTDWFPEPEHNYLYQAIGITGKVDAEAGTYTGPIGDGTIDMVIQAGGPYINNKAPSEQFYSDNNIHMAFVNTSDAIRNHVNTPTVAVFANFEKGPQILMWNPSEYDFKNFEDIGNSGATIAYFAGASYMEYLIHNGVVDEANTDSTYDGSPARFVSEGDLVQQGFATNEPYKYETQIEGWKKPVEFLLIHDSGHDIYQSALSVKPQTLTEGEECLKLLVPLFQRKLVEYMKDPGPLNVRLDEIVKELDHFWTSSIEGHNAASEALKELGLVTDGDNGYVGDMDEDRIQGLIDKLGPVYGAKGIEGFASDGSTDLTPSDIYTNRFLDTSISLGY